MEILIVYAILFAALCGFIAKNQGRDPGAWAIFGAIGGIFALLALVCTKPKGA